MLEREFERHAAAERLAEVDDARGVDVVARQQRGARRARVAIGPRLAGPAAAAAVAAIVEQQHVEPGGAQQRGVQHAVADVARVAVAQQHVRARRATAGRHPPAVQPLTVLGLDRHVLERQAGLGRCREDLALREEQQGVHQASHQRARAVRHGRSPAASTTCAQPPTGRSAWRRGCGPRCWPSRGAGTQARPRRPAGRSGWPGSGGRRGR